MGIDPTEDWIDVLLDLEDLTPPDDMPEHYWRRHSHREMDSKNISSSRSPQRDAKLSRDRNNCACVSSRAPHGQDGDGHTSQMDDCSCFDDDIDTDSDEEVLPITPDLAPMLRAQEPEDMLPVDLNEFVAYHAGITHAKELSESLEVLPSYSPLASLILEVEEPVILTGHRFEQELVIDLAVTTTYYYPFILDGDLL